MRPSWRAYLFGGPFAHHSFFVDVRGNIFAVGSNEYGQLGLGHQNNVLAPTRVEALDGKRIKQVACSREVSLFVLEGGEVHACGSNDVGQLGLETGKNFAPVSTPERVYGFGGGNVNGEAAKVVCGRGYGFCINNQDDLFAFGQNCFGRFGDGTKRDSEIPILVELGAELGLRVRLRSISAGEYHAVGLTSDGTCLTWGDNYYGQLGRNIGTDQMSHPQCVTIYEEESGTPRTFDDVKCGPNHTVALCTGVAYAWGYNFNGELGVGHSNHCAIPTKVNLRPDCYAEKVGVGFFHALFLCRDNMTEKNALEGAVVSKKRIFGCGYNGSKQLCFDHKRTGITTPLELQFGEFIPYDVICCALVSCAVDVDGRAFSCGKNIVPSPHMLERRVSMRVSHRMILNRLMKYVMSQQMIDSSLRVADSDISVFNAEGDEVTLAVDREYILLQCGVFPERLRISCDFSLYLTSMEDILLQIYSGRAKGLFETFDFSFSPSYIFSQLDKKRNATGDVTIWSKSSSGASGTSRRSFRAHKFVLAAMREYFGAMFAGGWLESAKSNIFLDMPLGESFDLYLSYLYTGFLNLNSPIEALDILKYVEYFDEGRAEDERLRNLLLYMSNSNAVEWKSPG